MKCSPTLYVSNKLVEEDCFMNISLNSDNNKDDENSALFGFYGTNFNQQNKAYLKMDNVAVRECSGNNNDGRGQLSDVYFTNFSIYNNEGEVLYHSYPWENVNWTVQRHLGASSSRRNLNESLCLNLTNDTETENVNCNTNHNTSTYANYNSICTTIISTKYNSHCYTNLCTHN